MPVDIMLSVGPKTDHHLRFLQEVNPSDLTSLEFNIQSNAESVKRIESFISTIINWNTSLAGKITANEGTLGNV